MSAIRTVAILGIGQMGTAAAVTFRRAGYRVLLWARNAEKLRAAAEALRDMESWAAAHFGAASRPDGMVELETDLDRVDTESDAVLECIIEFMDQKVALLRRLSSCRARGSLLLSATSGLSITEMGRRGGCEAALVGAHFWNPPHLIPLVEMVAGKDTPADTLERACGLMEDIGKLPVRCKDVPGFIGNRLMHAMWREALALVDAGVCSAADVDRVVKLTFALRLPALGPFENMDLVGLDAVERIQKYLLPELARDTGPAACLSAKVRNGDLGMQTGKGFYDWTRRDPKKLVEQRDRQIVRQLKFLREIGEL